MSEHDAFTQAIIENPDDDTPRLIYADWLEEHGQSELAEFILAQCELAKLPAPGAKTIRPLVSTAAYHESEGICVRCTDDAECRYHALRRREKELLNRHAHEWLFALPPGLRPLLPEVQRKTFRRGFIAEITLPCADWLAHREALLKTAPLEKVTLTNLPYEEDSAGDIIESCTLSRGQKFFIPNPSGGFLNLSFPNPGQTAASMVPKVGMTRVPNDLPHH